MPQRAIAPIIGGNGPTPPRDVRTRRPRQPSRQAESKARKDASTRRNGAPHLAEAGPLPTPGCAKSPHVREHDGRRRSRSGAASQHRNRQRNSDNACHEQQNREAIACGRTNRGGRGRRSGHGGLPKDQKRAQFPSKVRAKPAPFGPPFACLKDLSPKCVTGCRIWVAPLAERCFGSEGAK